MGFEAILREACVEADELYWKTFFEQIGSAPDVAISEEKDARLRSFIKNYEIHPDNSSAKSRTKGMKRGIKALLIAAIILLVVALTAFAFEPVRNFVFKIYYDCTEFVFKSVNGNDGDYLIADYSYIPEGYELVSSEKTRTEHTLIYMNGTSRIKIHTDQNEGSVLLIDTENAQTGNLRINNYDGYYSINRDTIIIVWSTGKYYHVITADVCDQITFDDVVKIAQSAAAVF